MPQQPPPPIRDPATLTGWSLWVPGIWLLRHAGGWGRALVLLTLSLLPALAWRAPAMGSDSLPRGTWLPLLLVALYFWICAHLVARPRTQRRPQVPSTATAGAVASLPEVEPAEAATLTAAPVTSMDAAIGAAAQVAAAVEVTADAEPVDPPRTSMSAGDLPEMLASPLAEVAADPVEEPAVEPSAELFGEPAVEPPAVGDPPPGVAGALPGLRLDHLQIHLAVDEIARRVVGSSGLLDSCATAAHSAIADVEALQDEERHAQKVLVALRARLVALDQRCHALAQAALGALGPGASDEQRAEVAKLAQAAQGQVLHSHQLAERLGATERGHGPRFAALRRNLEVTAAHAERGLGEAQQLMLLTRRIGRSLESAGKRLEPEAGRDDTAI